MRFNTASDETCTVGRPQEATNDARESARMMHKNDALESTTVLAGSLQVQPPS